MRNKHWSPVFSSDVRRFVDPSFHPDFLPLLIWLLYNITSRSELGWVPYTTMHYSPEVVHVLTTCSQEGLFSHMLFWDICWNNWCCCLLWNLSHIERVRRSRYIKKAMDVVTQSSPLSVLPHSFGFVVLGISINIQMIFFPVCRVVGLLLLWERERRWDKVVVHKVTSFSTVMENLTWVFHRHTSSIKHVSPACFCKLLADICICWFPAVWIFSVF